MTAGWLIVGLFIWIIFRPNLNFSEALLVSGCVTATDPVLAAAVVGKGKFAQRVPGHLRNLLSAESGCNDGMAFPFIFLAYNLIIHEGNAGEIVKEWICVTILYECIFGCILGTIIGWSARKMLIYCENSNLIDRESFLAIFLILAFACAGIGSIIGVDELLVAFAAGTAFAWNGAYAKKTEDSHISTVIDLILNLAYFVYFGAIIPWELYNKTDIGLPIWKFICLAIVIIFLRRIPAVMAIWKLTPDLNTSREALFAGHFGPIGVGAVYAVILARELLEEHYTNHESYLDQIPSDGVSHHYVITYLWPIVTFIILTSIIVHGSSVAVIVLGRHLRTVSFTMSFTQTQANPNSQSWMSRLPRLETNGRSFSLHKVDTMASSDTKFAEKHQQQPLSATTTIETSGIPVRPAGGMKKRKNFKKKKRARPVSENLDLNKIHRDRAQRAAAVATTAEMIEKENEKKAEETSSEEAIETIPQHFGPRRVLTSSASPPSGIRHRQQAGLPLDESEERDSDGERRHAKKGYQEGNKLIIDDENGEVMSVVDYPDDDESATPLSRGSSSKDSSEIRDSDTTIDAKQREVEKLRSETEEEEEEEEALGAGHGHGGFAHPGDSIQPIPTLHKDEKSRKKGKYFAFRIDDEIIIENEEGEIMKRYKIRKHEPGNDGIERQHTHQAQHLNFNDADKTPTIPAAASTLTKKALSLVGIRKTLSSTSTSSPTSATPGDFEKQHGMNESTAEAGERNSDLVLVPESEGVAHSAKDDELLGENEKHIQNKLANILDEYKKDGKKAETPKFANIVSTGPDNIQVMKSHSPPPRAVTSEDEDEDEEEEGVQNSDEGEYSEETEEETEEEQDHNRVSREEEETDIERIRRLNALGLANTGDRDSEDEEEEIRPTANTNSGPGLKLKWHKDV
ncbi:hypothetical protein PACTADRAFT_76638 [Pachysolen tannophilus NRRL Y-2460]|uniref:Na(+)/H(+) antiporter n=1 Tax=Pachysolen tannophilus NRRL Y-2460 TaxID=669874 RepID=A0A1E4TTJ3_PACTA|nr:hypothetical protein PACTADRAFT_76638 [Pachysolen tannophilus NRRL Y-2460]